MLKKLQEKVLEARGRTNQISASSAYSFYFNMCFKTRKPKLSETEFSPHFRQKKTQ